MPKKSSLPILIHEDRVGYDELLVEFYEHHCGFERVPRLEDDTFAQYYGDPDIMTAKYCPGCGERIVWRVK